MGLRIDWIKGLVRVTSDVYEAGPGKLPGIGTGAAYAAGDAFGTAFVLKVPKMGTISNAVLLDFDDEGLRKDIALFRGPFTETADNAAFAPSDSDLESCIGVISIDQFFNWSSNQIGIATPAFSYVAPTGKLYCQVITQGADNIAAGSVPKLFLVII